MVTRTDRLDRAQADAVRDLAAEVASADGFEAFSEQSLLNLSGSRPVRHLLVTGDGGRLDAYAQVAEGSAELATRPVARRRGIGGGLLDEVLHEPGVAVWAHGDLPAARSLADARGLRRVRDLWLMTARPPAEAPPPRPTPGVRVRTFEVGRDEEAWLAVNARAFSAHPEQGRMTRADLDERLAQQWFDPRALWLAEDEATGRLLGSMWAKIEGPVGEIYVLGVDPDAQGRGVGRLLTDVAMAEFAVRGLDRLELYVEGENTPAIRTYTAVGFRKERADVQYAR